MDNLFNIRPIPYNQMETSLPLVDALNAASLPMDVLQHRLNVILAMGHYECRGIYVDEELIGICGMWLLTKRYAGKHVEPDNVFIREKYRNKGAGKLMMEWLFNNAKNQGCIASEVNCHKTNIRGNKFWENLGYQPLANHLFKKF